MLDSMLVRQPPVIFHPRLGQSRNCKTCRGDAVRLVSLLHASISTAPRGCTDSILNQNGTLQMCIQCVATFRSPRRFKLCACHCVILVIQIGALARHTKTSASV